MVQSQLESTLKDWNLILEEKPHLSMNGLVAKVRWQDQSYILKIAPEQGDEHTAAALAHYNGQGAVRLIKSHERASLIERAIPGTHLSELVREGQDDRATHILCDVIEKLHSTTSFTGSFPTVEDLQKGFDRYLASGDTVIPRRLVEEARTLYQEMVATQAPPLLLHGDLHHDNVLYDAKRGWLAIDPKGYRGEPCYEIGAMMRNPFGCSQLYQSPEGLKRRVSIICERLGYDRKRVIHWSFSQAILAGIWSVEDGDSPQWALDLAYSFKRGLDFS